MSKDEVHFRVMRLIQENPQFTQRELARQLGVSLGKANYCLKALVEKGFVVPGRTHLLQLRLLLRMRLEKR